MTERAHPYITGPRRLPGLDGIRGIAILLVVVSHAEMAGSTMQAEWIARLGDLGVKLFFVLSGFLITTLLLQEQARTGRIAYGRFLVRRAFRILPAAYAFILCVIGASMLGWITLQPGDTLHALTYTAEFGAPSWWIGHLWSLSIEEQYYFVWPLILSLVRPRLGAWLMAGALVCAAVARGVILLWFADYAEGIERSFVAAIDGFAMGGLLAALSPALEGRAWYMRLLKSPWTPLLLPAAAVLDQFEHHPLVFYVALQFLVYLLLALWLHRSQVVTTDPSSRILNWPWLAWLGTISYSLYLWQQPFLAPQSVRLIESFPIAAGLSLLFALLSFHLIEKPFLRLRDRVVSANVSSPRQVVATARTGVGGAP